MKPGFKFIKDLQVIKFRYIEKLKSNQRRKTATAHIHEAIQAMERLESEVCLKVTAFEICPLVSVLKFVFK
jgi:hypothetical protein